MTEQPDDSPRRVVKKVVKKTVARPVGTGPARGPSSAGGRPPSAPPRQPPARLTTPARAQASRATSPRVAPAGPASPVSPRSAVPKSTAAAADVQPGAAPRTKRRVRGRARDLRHAIGDRMGDAVVGVRHRFEDAWDWLVSVRLPHLSPVRGSAITGVVVGLLSVLIGWGFYEIFSATLGTQAGGGWGVLAFVFLSFIAFIIGELLLAGFGVPHARVVSILSVLLVLLCVLVFFIELAAGVWAWLLIPALASGSFVISASVMAAAAKEQNPQRLPWEPVDESQVNRD